MTPYNPHEKDMAFALATFFGIACVVLFAFGLVLLDTQNKNAKVAGGQKTVREAEIKKDDPFRGVRITAQAAYVFDAATGETLYAKNAEAQLPLASVAKVMTALVASKVPQDTLITVKNADMQDGAGGLRESEKWSLKNLLNYTLVVSSNSGANAIAGAAGSIMRKTNPDTSTESDAGAFVRMMNEEARALGLYQTFYLNPSGLDMDVDSGLSGAYGSARDMTQLFAYIIKTKPGLLDATSSGGMAFSSLDGKRHLAQNTNITAAAIPGLIAGKTGYTILADGNLVVAVDIGPAHPIVVAVLGSTQEGRFIDVQNLIAASTKKITGVK